MRHEPNLTLYLKNRFELSDQDAKEIALSILKKRLSHVKSLYIRREYGYLRMRRA